MKYIKVNHTEVSSNRITVDFSVSEELRGYFNETVFWCEYSNDISETPEAVALIPFVCNILPIIWLTDAELILPALDKDFFECISKLKTGYDDMYPMLEFKGQIKVNHIESYPAIKPQMSRSAVFFSGGADAFCTLFSHIDEVPILVTLWGADIRTDNYEGWNIVRQHVEKTAQSFGSEAIFIKSNFREFLCEDYLHTLIMSSGDGWWHGFQHGIGLLGFGAVIALSEFLSRIYIASSYTLADKGSYTCASDPTIDNNVRFCGCRIIHDGYEYSRQEKIRLICRMANKLPVQPELRVCWESAGGRNCCHCEKCLRTILEIIVEGSNPSDFGFPVNLLEQLSCRKTKNTVLLNFSRVVRPSWLAIQADLSHKSDEQIPYWARWISNCDFDKESKSFRIRAQKFIKRVIGYIQRHSLVLRNAKK